MPNKDTLAYWEEAIFQNRPGGNWWMILQHDGKRRKWTLGTPFKAAAAQKAREYYRSILAEANKEFIQEWVELDRSKPLQRKLAARLRSRMRKALRGELKADHTLALLGCTAFEFIKWIELQFLPGMSWENYGGWHIDHIKPCAQFNLTRTEEQRACFHFTNLRPLWAQDNQRRPWSVIPNRKEGVAL